jgi:hypothetical protein
MKKVQILNNEAMISFKCPFCGKVLRRSIADLNLGVDRHCDDHSKVFRTKLILQYEEVEND